MKTTVNKKEAPDKPSAIRLAAELLQMMIAAGTKS